MNHIHTWWDDAIEWANYLTVHTMLRHRVSAVRDMVDGEYAVAGWHVDLAPAKPQQGEAAAVEPTIGTEPCS